MPIQNEDLTVDARRMVMLGSFGTFNFNGNPAIQVPFVKPVRIVSICLFNTTTGALTADTTHTVLLGVGGNTNAFFSRVIGGQVVPVQDQVNDPPATSNMLRIPVNVVIKQAQSVLFSQSGNGGSTSGNVIAAIEWEPLDTDNTNLPYGSN